MFVESSRKEVHVSVHFRIAGATLVGSCGQGVRWVMGIAFPEMEGLLIVDICTAGICGTFGIIVATVCC